jgi:hypothetical protein
LPSTSATRFSAKAGSLTKKMAAAASAHRHNFSDPDIIMTPPEPYTFYHTSLRTRSRSPAL